MNKNKQHAFFAALVLGITPYAYGSQQTSPYDVDQYLPDEMKTRTPTGKRKFTTHVHVDAARDAGENSNKTEDRTVVNFLLSMVHQGKAQATTKP